jgi:hypothetical protein
MKSMLLLPPYHIIIVMLSQINFTLTMFEDYFISIRPFINTPLITSRISIILVYMIIH